jgi:ATP-dependent Clp protease protease subunit
MNPQEFQKYAVGHLGMSSNTLHDYSSYVSHQIYSGVPGISNLTPNIIEERQMNVVAMDVFSRLMMDRIIFLGTGINDQVANIVSAQLLFLQSTDAKRDISIYINSPGGSVYAGLGIYDTMQIVAPDVATICTGMAASMGAVLLTAGAAGKRSGLPHSRVMIHQPMGGAQGQASDIAIVHEEIQRVKKELYEIIAKHSGQTYETIWNDSDRDKWMMAEEAQKYGLIDEVMKYD